MITLLHAQNPDNGASVPVVIDSLDIQLTSVQLSRADVEGNPAALRGVVAFDTSAGLPDRDPKYLLEVYLYVLTEGYVATMRESMTISSMSELRDPWDLYTTSGGKGAIHAALVKIHLHPQED